MALSHTYSSLETARQSLRQVGEQIKSYGLPKPIRPLVILFTGSGNVSKGAQEIANELPIKFIDPKDLKAFTDHDDGTTLYGSVVGPADYCHHKEGKAFAIEEYMKHPRRYQSHFSINIAPFATAIVNGIYWEQRFPRLLTREQADQLCSNPNSRLVTIADISCDIQVRPVLLSFNVSFQGSIEITHKATKIDDPFFEYGVGPRYENSLLFEVKRLDRFKSCRLITYRPNFRKMQPNILALN